jgi:cell division protein FtsB
MSVWVLIYRISSALVIAVALIWVGSLFYPQFKQVGDLSAKQQEIEAEIHHDAEILRHLRLKQERLLNDPRYVEKIAREELGLAKPGETVFKFVDDPTPLNARTGVTGRALR